MPASPHPGLAEDRLLRHVITVQDAPADNRCSELPCVATFALMSNSAGRAGGRRFITWSPGSCSKGPYTTGNRQGDANNANIGFILLLKFTCRQVMLKILAQVLQWEQLCQKWAAISRSKRSKEER